jgi:hypothetical protein
MEVVVGMVVVMQAMAKIIVVVGEIIGAMAGGIIIVTVVSVA